MSKCRVFQLISNNKNKFFKACKYNIVINIYLEYSIFFMNAKQLKKFWNEVYSWVSLKLGTKTSWALFDICFRFKIFKPELLTNHLILIARSYIYICKVCVQTSILSRFLKVISSTRRTKRTIAKLFWVGNVCWVGNFEQ